MWYAVWVRTGQEEKVRETCRKRLAEADAFEECFLPKYERPWKEHGKWIKKEEVLFPGYLFFVAQDSQKLNTALRNVPEFTKLLGDEEGAIALYPQEVEFLEKHINDQKVFEMSIGEIIGQELVIREGPMKDLTGKVVFLDRHKRIAVLEVEFFGRTVKMKVGMEIVGRKGVDEGNKDN